MIRARTLRLALLLPLLLAGTAADAAAAEGIALRGRVLADEGRPLAGAEVALRSLRLDLAAVRARVRGLPAPPPARAVRTAADGSFELAAPGPGMWELTVSAAGYAARQLVLAPLLEPRSLPPVALPPAVATTVTVRSAGQPAAGAEVRVEPVGAEKEADAAGRWTAARQSARADAAGKAVFLLPRQGAQRVRAVAPGYVEAAARVGPAPAAVTLELRRGLPRTLLVRSAAGAPAAGVIVHAGDSRWPVAVTDETGSAVVSVPAAGTIRIDLDAGDRQRPGERIGAAAAGQPAAFLLPRSTRLAGRLVDAGSGAPVAGGVVWAHGKLDRFAMTDAAGGFVLEGLHASDSWLDAAAAGYFPADAVLPRGAPAAALAIALRPAAAAEGRLVAADGRPVRQAEVRALLHRGSSNPYANEPEPGASGFATSDAEGVFRLAPLSPGAIFRLDVTAEGFAPATAWTGVLAAGRNALPPVQLGRGRPVSGRFEDALAQPVAGVEVEVRPFAAVPEAPGGPPDAGAPGGAAAPPRARSDAAGRFEIPRLGPGRYSLRARRGGYAPLELAGIEVPAGEGAFDLGVLRLDAGVAVAGVVRTTGGEPIPGAEVRVAEGPAAAPLGRDDLRRVPVSARSGEDGGFTVGDRRAGERLALDVRRAGYVPALLAGIEVPAAGPVEIELKAAARVSGRVLDAGRQPLVRAGVRLLASREGDLKGSGGGGAGEGLTDGEGRFSLAGIEPGTLRLIVSAPGYARAELDGLRVAEGEHLEGLEVVLSPGATLAGRVRLPGGGPAVGATVRLLEESPFGAGLLPGYQMAVADGEGAYRLTGVPSGQQSVSAEYRDLPRAVRQVRIEEGEQSLDFELAEGFTVEGLVLDATGQGVAGAEVRLYPPGRPLEAWETLAAAGGSFRFANVPKGAYELAGEKAGRGKARLPGLVRVERGSVTGLELKLAGGTLLTGRVLGVEGPAVAEVEVRAVHPRLGRRDGRVDSSGAYEVPDLAAGDWLVLATLPREGRGAEARVAVAEGAERASADLDFGAGFVLTGLATRNGEPVAGATLLLRGREVASLRQAVTDPAGRFRITGLSAGLYGLTLEHPGGRHEQAIEVERDLDVVVELGNAALGGTVRSAADARPVPAARVTAWPAEGDGVASQRVASTDDAGRFRLAGLAAGAWQVQVEKAGFVPARQSLELAAGGGEAVLDVALEPGAGGRLQPVLLEGGAPGEVHVAVLDGAGGLAWAGTYPVDPAGQVQLSSLAPGTWQALVGADGRSPERVTLAAPGPPVPVVLKAAGSLAVEVPELAGSQVIARLSLLSREGQPLVAVERGGTLRNAWPLLLGSAVVHGVPAGSWTLRAEAPDGRRWEAAVQVGMGELVRARLE